MNKFPMDRIESQICLLAVQYALVKLIRSGKLSADDAATIAMKPGVIGRAEDVFKKEVYDAFYNSMFYEDFVSLFGADLGKDALDKDLDKDASTIENALLAILVADGTSNNLASIQRNFFSLYRHLTLLGTSGLRAGLSTSYARALKLSPASIAKPGGADVAAKTPDDLIREWNAAGRGYIRQLNALIADDYEGRATPEAWPTDPRKFDDAEAILALVEAVDREGRWRPDAPIADRAYDPLIDALDYVCLDLKCVTILGPDEFLLRLGSIHQPGSALHLRGDDIRELPDVLAIAISRNHELLLLVREDGFSVSRGLDAPVIRHFPWPDKILPRISDCLFLDCLQLSDDGLTVAFVLGNEAVWLGQADDPATTWTRVHPSDALLAEIGEEEKDNFSDSTMHCALSPDGRFIAYGSESHGHFIDWIEGVATLRRWAHIGPRSEYPNCAWFSDDGATVALSSYHHYNGATLRVRLSEIEGLSTEKYAEHERATLIDGNSRVYGTAWLPLGSDQDGFALAGTGYLNIVSSGGTIMSSTHFGSIASSIDYCPKTGILAVGSYAAVLHVYAPNRQAEADQAIGYRPIRELYRWVLRSRGREVPRPGERRAPFRW